MKRTALALCILPLLGVAVCGCSNSRPFWMANKPKAGSTELAAAKAATDQADSSFMEWAKNEPAERSLEGPLALARLAEHGGSPADAERLYRSIMEKNPENAVAPHRLAIMQAQKGKFEAADRYFQRALELTPDDPTLLSDAGYHYYLQNRLDEAESLYRQALEILPNHEATTNNLAILLGERGDHREALSLFRQTGTEAEAYGNMGFLYACRGDLKKAQESYNHALSLDPRMKSAAEALIQLSQIEQRTDALIAEYSKPQIHAGNSVARNARDVVNSRVMANAAIAQRSQSQSPNRTAGYAEASRPAPALSVQPAEFIRPTSKAISSDLSAFCPETPQAADAGELEPHPQPLPPVQRARLVDAQLEAISSGFAQGSNF